MLIFQPKQKLEIFQEYFGKVYSLEKHHLKNTEMFIFKADLPALELEHVDILEREMQEQEIKQVNFC